jgi:hypothetical protein
MGVVSLKIKFLVIFVKSASLMFETPPYLLAFYNRGWGTHYFFKEFHYNANGSADAQL